METLVLVAIAVLIGTRLLSMLAYSPSIARRPFLELFKVDRWVLFRGLILLTGSLIGYYAIRASAWGHGLGNGALAVFTILPRSVYQHSWLRSTFHALLRTTTARVLFFAGGAAVCGALGAWTAASGQALAEFCQGTGGWLLVAAMFSMMMQLWGERSAASWTFIGLCLTFDTLLLAGAILLKARGLIVLEIATLTLELSIAARTWRSASSEDDFDDIPEPVSR